MSLERIFASSFGCAMLFGCLAHRLGLDEKTTLSIILMGVKFGAQLTIINCKNKSKDSYETDQ